MPRLVVGTRGSALALWQARHVARQLRDLAPEVEVEERIITTEGDVTSGAFGPGDRGVFVRRIEDALLAGEIDIAVHSLKDLPSSQPEGLQIAAVPQRQDPRDALLSASGWSFDELPRGSVIGTGSPRRRAQLLHFRRDLRTTGLRGNVDTRVRKLEQGDFDALVLALAGLRRLDIDTVPLQPIPESVCVPAVGQGALAIETREDDPRTRRLVAPLEDPASRAAIDVERSFLRRLGGGCLAPVGALAQIVDRDVRIVATVGDPDGERLLRESGTGPLSDGAEIGIRLAELLLEQGAEPLLQRARERADEHG